MSTALVVDGHEISWHVLGVRAALLARSLARAGVEPGELVATLVSSRAFAELFYASRHAGVSLLPLNPRLAAPELRFQLADANARWLLDEPADSLLDDLQGVGRLRFDAEGLVQCVSAPQRTAAPGPGEGATLIYTSGTTGQPKGAVISRKAFQWGARAAAELLGAAPSDRWLACMPLFHVGGIAILERCELAKATVVVHPRFDAEAVSDALEGEGVTHVSLVASMLERLLAFRGTRRAPSSLRLVLVGGGATPALLLERAIELGYPVAPTYGLTETASQVATRPPNAPATEGLTPLPGVEIEIVGAAGQRLEPASEGEIRLRSGSVMDGYWRRPDETARALRNGWLYTGDIGKLDALGRLRVLDRRCDLIVSGGENIYPAEVEAVLAAHPAVVEAGVAGRGDDHFGARPHAWFVGEASPDELQSFCEARLARYKIPVAFERVAALPRGPAGKLLRAKLGRS